MKLSRREDIVLLLLAFLVLSGAGFRLWLREGDVIIEVWEESEASLVQGSSSFEGAESLPSVSTPSFAETGAAEALRINVNTASAWELERLPGIGPALAGRIVAERERHGPFITVDELVRVSGIGPKVLERLRPHVIVK
ncbi:MAG: helix-hairpin-helix domain-containing protein [Firmicutes bacterium]|nr:helix-hairpin-helix domain-containing protein [Bacillota bacterium]